VLVNNAGFSVFGAFECASESDVQRQLNTNLLGVMNVTRAVLPHFRQRKAGRIISVTSVGGLVAFPLFTLYHASKWAVEGFMESLHYELKPFNIQVKIIELGAVNTHLTENTVVSKSNTIADYDQFVDVAFPVPGAIIIFSGLNHAIFRGGCHQTACFAVFSACAIR